MPDLAQLVTAQAALTAKTSTALLRQILAFWATFTPSDWWNDDLVSGNAAKSASLVESALSQVRLHQRSFQSQVFKMMHVSAPLPPPQFGYSRANTNPFQVYARPAKQLRFLQSQGLEFDEAYMRAKTRVQKMADADLQRAQFGEAQSASRANPRVIGTRRIIHPELSRSGTCGLCVVAATRFYTLDELQALHDECHCTTLPVTAKDDPGLKLNDQDLKEIYAAAGGTQAPDLLNTRVAIGEHGELGPVLIKHGDHFRTPAEAGRPAFQRQTPETIRTARLAERTEIAAALEQAQSNYAALLKTQTPGQGDALAQFRAIKYMKERATQLDQFLATH